FFYYPDHFQKPNPFQPDIVVSIDSSIDKKLDALVVMVSQFQEGGANGSDKLMPSDADGQKKRTDQVRTGFGRRNESLAKQFRSKLSDWYSEAGASKIKYAEAFEICEY